MDDDELICVTEKYKNVKDFFAKTDLIKFDTHNIHFNNVELCDKFKEWYTGSIGHTCCDGRGCLLKGISEHTKVNEIHIRIFARK